MTDLVKFDRVPVQSIDGKQYLFEFDNGYGASVVQNDYSYGGKRGLWELAVIQWEDGEFSIVYDTPVTNEVIGWLTPNEVAEILHTIENLPERG